MTVSEAKVERKTNGRLFMTLSERIREQRIRCSMTQKQLANLVGVSATSVYNWERGAYLPDSLKLTKIAGVLGTTSSYLQGESDEIKAVKACQTEAADNDGTFEDVGNICLFWCEAAKMRNYIQRHYNNLPSCDRDVVSGIIRSLLLELEKQEMDNEKTNIKNRVQE